MKEYIVQMGMDEFVIDENEFNAVLRCDDPSFGRLLRLKDIDGKVRWVNILQIKMIEEAGE